MQDENYIYEVARVHIHERCLLDKNDVEQLISADDVPKALSLLSGKGWGAQGEELESPSALVEYELAQTWSLISGLMDDISVFDVFRISNDYHNLKAAIKLEYSGELDRCDRSRYFIQNSTIPVDSIIDAVKAHEFHLLPEAMSTVGREAYEALVQTGNGQLCDMAIDRRALVAIHYAGVNSGSDMLRRYAEIIVDCANIKATMRCALAGKDRRFIDDMLPQVGTLDVRALASAAAKGAQAVHEYVDASAYGKSASFLKESLSSFERWRDNQIIQLIRQHRHNSFGIEPLAAFVLGRENDIQIARLILSAKINGFGENVLRERLRDTYA